MTKAANMATQTRAKNGWTKEHIQHLLATNDMALMRGLIQIYNRQTEDEKRTKDTKEDNSVGFTGSDGKILTDIAQKLIKFKHLTPNQLSLVRKKMGKYWRQLLEIAAESEKGPNFVVPAKKPEAANETMMTGKQSSFDLAAA